MGCDAELTRTPTKVLSIVGPGRSGTTILASILGEVQGIVNAGELRWLWQRGLIEQRPCGCGRPPVDCPVWSTLLDRLLEDGVCLCTADELATAVSSVIRDHREVTLRRNRLRAIRGATGGATDWAAMARMRAVTAEVCSLLAEVTGARMIIDTSKGAQEAALLAAVDRIDQYVLQIVRDPRAVAYSWRRTKPVPISRGATTMATRGLLASVGRWAENCLGAELLRRYVPHDRWLFLRYEDFVAAPRMSVNRVLAFVGVGTEGPFVSDDTVVLGTNHTVSGNPNRFRTGSVRIVEDDEWSAWMARREQMVIEAIAMPLLLRYGYPIRTAPRRVSS